MKNFFFVFLFCVCASVCLGQSISESVFPIGAFGFGYFDSTKTKPIMDSGRFNALYNADPTLIYKLGANTNGYTGDSGYVSKYIGGKFKDWHCSDMRFFLATQEKYVKPADGQQTAFGTRSPQHNTSDPKYTAYRYDLLRSWKHAAGSLSTDRNEWQITQLQNSPDGILLDSLQVSLYKLDDEFVDNDSDRRSYFVNNDRPFNNSTRYALCDFIYRIDTTGSSFYSYTITAPTDKLYEIEYVRHRRPYRKSTGALWSSSLVDTSQSVFITKDGFKHHGGDETLWATDHSNVRTFNAKPYAILRTPVRIEPDTMSGDTVWQTISVECRLKTAAKSFGIFIRGLRVRSVDADSLLRGNFGNYSFGKLYNDFLQAYYYVRRQAGADSVAAWNKIPAVTVNGENSSPTWRAYAYIDNQWKQFCKAHGGTEKRIYTFLAENTYTSKYPWFRSIYEDETGNVPPPILPQCDGLGGLGLDRNGGTYPLGYPRDIIPRARQTSIADFTLFCTPIQNDSLYTVNYQSAAEELCKRRTETLAAFPPNATPGNWIALLNCRMDFREPDLLKTIRADSIKVEGTKPLWRFIKDQLKNGLCNDRDWKSIRFCEIADTNDVAYTHTTDSIWNNHYRQISRSLTAPELRADAWKSICFGAKGLLWNTLANDGGHDVGLVNLDYSFKSDWWDDDSVGGMKPLLTFFLRNNICKYPAVPENKWDYFLIQKKDTNGGAIDDKIPVSHTSILSSIVNTSPISLTYDSATIADNLNNATTGWQNTHPAGAGKWWAPVMIPDNDCRTLSTADSSGLNTTQWSKNRRWAAYFDSTSCYIWNSYHWAYRGMMVKSWVPTFYGFKERFRGAQSVSNDVIPIAKKLSELIWQRAGSYMMLKDSNFKNFPLKGYIPSDDKTSQLVSRYTYRPDSSDKYVSISAYDSTNGQLHHKPYIFFGLFKHPVDNAALFVSLVNHRTWPIIYTYTDTSNPSRKTGIKVLDTPTDSLKGAIDARRFNFQVNPSVFGDSSAQKVYNIMDLRTGRERVVAVNDTFSLILEPGEGTLLRVAPAIGITLGGMTDNLFNNGRHIAAVEGNNDSLKQFLTTYSQHGNIVVSYPIETPTGISKRIIDTPAETKIDSSGNCYNPSIAYNHSKNTIGLTYRKVFPGPTKDTIKIMFRRSHYQTSTTFSAATLIDSFIAEKDYISPPAITPKNTSGVNEFWLAYNHPDLGGVIDLLDTNGTVAQGRNFWGVTKTYVKFVSIAAHVPFDTVHIAFEEGNNTKSEIFYLAAYLDNFGVQLKNNPALNISKGLNSCQNHNPQIAIRPDQNFIDVVWEAIRISRRDSVHPEFAHYVVLRTRIGFGGLNLKYGRWSDFTVFVARNVIIQPHEDGYPATYIYRAYPNISSSNVIDLSDTSSQTWKDWQRITWSNKYVNELGTINDKWIDIARWGGSGNWKIAEWDLYAFLEPSQEPAMVNLSYGNIVAQPFLYRHTTLDKETDLYGAKIIRYDFPSNPLRQRRATFSTIRAFGAYGYCDNIVTGKIGNISQLSGTTPMRIPLHGLADSVSDSNAYAPIEWNDKKGVRTFPFHISSGDTLSYQRFFRVGEYKAGDTAATAYFLHDSSDYIVARVFLRKVVNDSILTILDTAKLTKSGFVQTGGLLNGGWKTFISSLTDSVYITMEMNRGDTTNPFILSRIESINDVLFDAYPSTTPAYKLAPDIPARQSPVGTNLINLKVFPNPFDKETHITVEVPKDIPLEVSVYDVLGNKITDLFNGIGTTEQYEFTLDGRIIGPGTYFVRVQAGNDVETRKIQFVR